LNLEALELVASALKYLAVPAAALEFLKLERRQAIEAWVAGTLPRLVKGMGISVVFLYVTVALLVVAGPWLVLLYFVFGRAVWQFAAFAVASDDKPDAATGCVATGCLFSVVVFTGSVLEKWLMPESWVVAMAIPYERFSVWANQHWLIDWVLPDFTTEGYLANYRRVLEMAEAWLWDWLAWIYQLYFFFARGLMLVLVGAIQLAFFASIVLAVILVPLAPLHAVMYFSEAVKRKMKFEAMGRVPVGAFLVWGTGETLEFVVRVIQVAD